MSLILSSILSLGSAAWIWWMISHPHQIPLSNCLLFIAVGAFVGIFARESAKTGMDRFNVNCALGAFFLSSAVAGLTAA